MNKRNELIKIVSNEIANLFQNPSAVTLGGSMAHNLDDNHSDIEMYFYFHGDMPSLKEITQCLEKLNAKHKRCPNFLWNMKPWGPHSFFLIDDIYFEIGYRNIDETKEKILNYQKGNVGIQLDCNDLGLGYMPSALASSVIYEKILIDYHNEIVELKELSSFFSIDMIHNLKKEFFDTANSLLYGKLLTACKRGDIFLYNVISNRVIRCLMIMAFALGSQNFPGDKWNEQLLLRSNWGNSKNFLNILKKDLQICPINKKNLFIKRKILLEAFELIRKDLEEAING